jgi:hypothetical protein
VRDVVSMGDMRGAHKILSVKSDKKRSLGR